MLHAERRAREIAENAQADAEAAREEAVRAREEAEGAHRLETQARERLQVLVEAGVAMAASRETRSVLAAATGAAARRACDYSLAFVVDRGPEDRRGGADPEPLTRTDGTDDGAPFAEEDLSLAGMLAARAGLAVDNVRL